MGFNSGFKGLMFTAVGTSSLTRTVLLFSSEHPCQLRLLLNIWATLFRSSQDGVSGSGYANVYLNTTTKGKRKKKKIIIIKPPELETLNLNNSSC